MTDGLGISISGGDALDRVVAQLRSTEESLPGEVFGAIEQETMRLIEIARAAVRAMPTHGEKSTGLRDTIADGVGMQVESGTAASMDVSSVGATSTILDTHHIRVTTSVPHANMETIPAGLDAGEWHHPLFGMKNYWYTQHGLYSWFTQTFSDGKSAYMREVYAVLDTAAKRIAAAAKS